MTEKPAYGTTEYYKEYFSDCIGDAATGDPTADAATTIALLQGFEQAIIEWMTYHEDAVKQYRELHRRFLLGDTSENN
jgi:hypothetical protein